MIVYRAYNKITGKCYVGITTQTFVQRKMEHYSRALNSSRQHKFYLAIRKYGFDSFEWEIIDRATTLEELTEKEKCYIKQYNSYARGYNCNEGGTIVSEETKKLISKALTGRIVTWGQKTKATRIERDNYRNTIVASGADNVNSKSYLIVTPDGASEVITGLRAFCREHGLSHNLMLAVSNGSQKHHKGYKCHILEPSTTIPQGSTPQANGGGNGEHP